MNEVEKPELESRLNISVHRHSKKVDPGAGVLGTESKQYPGLSEEEGVTEAQEVTKNEIMNMIEQLPDKAIVLMGGVSTQKRARSTTRVYLDTLEKIVQDRQDIDFINLQEKSNEDRMGYFNAINQINEESEDKKIILGFPLKTRGIDNFSYWRKPDGNLTEYAQYLYDVECDPKR